MGLGEKERGCGSGREKGGVYLECGDAGVGEGLESLIQDPVTSIDPDSLGISPVGVKLIEMGGVTHVFDWVGEKHYPNAADFLEEAVRLGVSRRISRNADFSKLTPGSKLILIHPKGFIQGGEEFFSRRQIPCPAAKHARGDRGACAGRLWLVGKIGSTDFKDRGAVESWLGEFPEWARSPVLNPDSPTSDFLGIRTMPSFDYPLGELPHPDAVSFSPGVIMIVPISRIAVVADPDDPESTSLTKEAALMSSLPVTLEDL